MSWSKTPPAAPGFYFMRFTFDGNPGRCMYALCGETAHQFVFEDPSLHWVFGTIGVFALKGHDTPADAEWMPVEWPQPPTGAGGESNTPPDEHP
mgnify:CR=1 FL=1